MTTIRLHNLGAVAQTLIIPLYFRAMESRRPDSLIKDWKAVELVEQIDYDFAKAKRQSFDQVRTILRVREFDNRARAFLARHPDAVIVHMGCGLDTRFDRVDNGRVVRFRLYPGGSFRCQSQRKSPDPPQNV